MCKYAKNKGIVIRTKKQKETVLRILLQSQKQTAVSSAQQVGAFDPSLWKFQTNL